MVHAFEQNECYALRRLRSSMASLHRLYICARGEKTTRQELGVPCVERKRCKGLFLEKVFGIFASPWRYTPAKEEEQKEQAKEYLPCSRLRSTLELEAQYICPGDTRGQQVGDGRHCRSVSTRVDHKAQTLRSRTLARNAEDRGREHSQASDFQTVALSSEKAGSISQQVQAGVESQKESPQFVDRVYRREYKEMDEAKFAEEFASKDKELEDRVKGAAEKLQEAKEHLDDVKEKHTKQDETVLQDIEIVSDENMDEETMKSETSETIKKGITSMLEGLDKVRIRAPTSEETEEGNASKKPRVEAGGKDSAVLGARALQPFGGADK